MQANMGLSFFWHVCTGQGCLPCGKAAEEYLVCEGKGQYCFGVPGVSSAHNFGF
jgi:hypothetical protein